MVVESITEAKAQLSALIERVQEGEIVIIKKAGKPVAVLNAYAVEGSRRVLGALKGQIRIGEDFDELPNDIAEALGTHNAQ